MKTKKQNHQTIEPSNSQTNLKIAFFGTPRIASITLEKLIATKFAPSLVITGPDIQKGRGQKLSSSPVKNIAEKNHIKVLEPQDLLDKSFLNVFNDFSPDVAILVAYGKLIPPKILKIPEAEFVNIHPSLLPKYRGPSPIQSAILENEAETGVTIIKLDEELDHGPIISQKAIKIAQKDTTDSLTEKLARIGADLLIESLPGYLSRQIKLQEQNHTKATYTKKITKEDGHIDLENPPDTEKLNRMIRAFFPWPGVYTKLKMKNEKLKIIKFLPSSLVTQQPGNPFLVQPEGKKSMTIKEFLNGYPQAKEQIEKLRKR